MMREIPTIIVKVNDSLIKIKAKIGAKAGLMKNAMEAVILEVASMERK